MAMFLLAYGMRSPALLLSLQMAKLLGGVSSLEAMAQNPKSAESF
jgi:hypothetical protein